jgi:tetratricopeptide (TPR) repeat protein
MALFYKGIVENQRVAEAAGISDYQRAADAYRQALVNAGDLERPRLKAVLYYRLGKLHEQAGHPDRAIEAYRAGIDVLDRASTPPITDGGTTPPGGNGQVLGRDQLPPELETVARGLEADEADPTLAYKLLVALGDLLSHAPAEGPALERYRAALAEPALADLPGLRARTLTQVAALLVRSGEIDAASRTIDEALGLLADSPPAARRRAMVVRAEVDVQQQAFKPAERLYRQAIALYAPGDDPEGATLALIGLGDLLYYTNRVRAASRAYRRALQAAPATSDLRHAAWWGLGRSQRRLGHLQAAGKSFRASLDSPGERRQKLATEEGQVRFQEGLRPVYDALIDVLLQRAARHPVLYAEALNAVEEARGEVLIDLIGHRVRLTAPTATVVPG